MTISVSVAGRNAGLDGLGAHIDTGASASEIVFYDGTIPADVTASIGASTMLATSVMNATAFAAASAASMAASAIGQVSVAASGTITYFRIEDGSGVAVIQGSAGDVGGEDCDVDVAAVVLGGNFNVTSLSISQALS